MKALLLEQVHWVQLDTEHIRAIDKSRLSGYITDMGADDLAEIERAVCKILGIKAAKTARSTG